MGIHFEDRGRLERGGALGGGSSPKRSIVMSLLREGARGTWVLDFLLEFSLYFEKHTLGENAPAALLMAIEVLRTRGTGLRSDSLCFWKLWSLRSSVNFFLVSCLSKRG